MSDLLADTRVWYTLLIVVIAVQRLIEVRVSNANTARLLSQGAVEHGQGHFPAMVSLHTAFLVCCVAEAWLSGRSVIAWLALAMLGLLALTQGLRYWALRTLGSRWTVRVITVPDSRPIHRGPYRWIRHPNYLAVIIELVAIPLVHSAWLTALVFSVLNAWLLKVRIRVEEKALEQAGEYEQLMPRPRWAPSGTRR